MALDQLFKANFAQTEITSTATDTPPGYTVDSTELFGTDSSVRNLCLVWSDGRKAFFNYAYLAAAELRLQESLNELVLYFSGQTVTLKGYQLELLFELLLDHIPKTIIASDPRYDLDSQTTNIIVIDIAVKSE